LRASVDSGVLFHRPQDTLLAGGAKDTSTEHMIALKKKLCPAEALGSTRQDGPNQSVVRTCAKPG